MDATDIPIPLPDGEGEQPEGVDMAVDATIDKVLDQAYTRAHENFLGTMQHAADGHQALLETGRWTFQAAASNQVQLASGILAQRSAQAQPQQMPGPGGTGIPAGMKLVPE